MIVTILHSSAGFNAVQYNQNKASNGTARLIEIKNFGPLENNPNRTVGDLIDYLKTWSAQNSRIKKPQFHVAISCKGNEMTHQQLLDFAHKYLDEMGYGQPGQPVLIYSHHDTGNNHIHIITSRIGPDGKKINDSNERIRSQAVVNKLLNVNTDVQIHTALENAKKYSFSSLPQFKALLESMGYKSFVNNNDELCIMRDGVVKESIPVNDIKALMKPKTKIPLKKKRKLFAILSKYRDLSVNKQELIANLRKSLGIELVFFGQKDNPYGYIIIDHKNKEILPGNSVMNLKSLLKFISPQDKILYIDSFIDKCLENNPYLTSKQLSNLLRSSNAYIKDYKLYDSNSVRDLNPILENTLKRNNKIYMANSFNPTSPLECSVLKAFFKLDINAPVNLVSPTASHGVMKDKLALQVETLISHSSDFWGDLQNHNIIPYKYDDKYFFLDLKSKTIISADEYRLSLPVKSTSNNITPNLKNINRERNYGPNHVKRGQNREWEISDGSFDEDDKRNIKY